MSGNFDDDLPNIDDLKIIGNVGGWSSGVWRNDVRIVDDLKIVRSSDKWSSGSGCSVYRISEDNQELCRTVVGDHDRISLFGLWTMVSIRVIFGNSGWRPRR